MQIDKIHNNSSAKHKPGIYNKDNGDLSRNVNLPIAVALLGALVTLCVKGIVVAVLVIVVMGVFLSLFWGFRWALAKLGL